jgi:hypothetical protein
VDTTVIAVVMAVVNITDINQPRCNTKRSQIESAFFMSLLFIVDDK